MPYFIKAGNRVGAVVYEVPEKDPAVNALAVGMGHAGPQGLKIAMNVGEDSDTHQPVLPLLRLV